ncbi:hypothetical protein Tco_0728898 [Tanacetum coccineum]|uniref:Uncharacterized protein n=1 Tax=Tanacetum coccineum TaxID=301880 RepID=A0ABQ4YQ43_9ASTR
MFSKNSWTHIFVVSVDCEIADCSIKVITQNSLCDLIEGMIYSRSILMWRDGNKEADEWELDNMLGPNGKLDGLPTPLDEGVMAVLRLLVKSGTSFGKRVKL